MSIYVSTSCLIDGKNVINVLDNYARLNLKNVELGSSHIFVQNLIDRLKSYDFNFMVHNYFPPARIPFYMNLASPNPIILKNTLKKIQSALKLCNILNSDLYSFHPGFRIEPNILPLTSDKLNKIKPLPYDKAFNIFVINLKKIINIAENLGIKIAVENHVATNQTSRFLFLYSLIEFEKLFESINSENLGILLDFGHLKVTAHWLKFNKNEFIEGVKHRVFSVHVHENNSIIDEHKPIKKSSWFFKYIKKKPFKNIPIVLESTNLTISQIVNNINFLENKL